MRVNFKKIPRSINTKYLILNTFLFLLLSTIYLLLATNTYATDPVPPPYVGCDQTANPEFHSDRPYQASPCNEPPSTLPQEPQALLCGNDLAFKEVLTVTPSEATSCTTLASGGRRCSYKVNPGVRIKIDLSNTDLPILGNTEDVPNSTQNTASLDSATRVNEYLSWYLNGVINPATEEDRTDYPSSENSLVKNPPTPEFINKLVNFSGPIRKLLPWSGQARERINQIEYAIGTYSGSTEENASKLRHDQIVGCTAQFLLGEKPASCYFPSANILSGTIHRLSSWVGHLPPFEEYYSRAQDYWRAMIEWRGGICIDFLGGYSCLNTGVSHFWSQLFAYIPFTSTEDKKGSLQFVGKTEPSTIEQGDVKVTSQSFSPTNPDTTRFLYFPHTEESAQLGEILQKTYLPKDEKGYIPEEDTQTSSTATSGTGILVPGGNCEILDSRTNPGDDVFGEYTEEGDNQIEGMLNYTAEFTCDFPQARSRNFCEANCDSEDTTCIDACLGGKCKKDITVVAGSVFTKTPNADEIFGRFVTGAFSAFRRIFPQVGVGAPVTEIEDIPAVTTANYGAIPSGRSGDVTPLAGNPANNRPGGSAQVFFSHIGSVSEYFLKGIQTALRPKGYGSPIVSGSQDLGIHPPTSDWEFDGSPVTDPPPDNPEIQTAINQAASDVGIPACVLEGVGIIEGAYNWTPDDPRIAQCKPNQCSAAGPFQISTGKDASGDRFCSQCSAWTRAYGCPNVWAGRSGNPCDFVLSSKVAAQKLKNDGPLNNTQSVQEQKNQIINAGYHYYGSNGRIPRLDNCSYGQYVYKHCDPSYNCN